MITLIYTFRTVIQYVFYFIHCKRLNLSCKSCYKCKFSVLATQINDISIYLVYLSVNTQGKCCEIVNK